MSLLALQPGSEVKAHYALLGLLLARPFAAGAVLLLVLSRASAW